MSRGRRLAAEPASETEEQLHNSVVPAAAAGGQKFWLVTVEREREGG